MSISANQFAKRLRQLSQIPLRQGEQVLLEVSKEVSKSIDSNFERKEDSQGRPWPKHSAFTIELQGVHELLVLSGRLRRAARGGAGSLRRVVRSSGKEILQLGISKSSVPYFPAHQYGQGRIPRREFFYLPGNQRAMVVGILRQQLKHQIRKKLRWRA
jgi:phage gpG-like protein